MADTMQFDLVSPEKNLASLEATEVQIPAAEGDLTAMAGHAPLITTLRPGILKIQGSGETQAFAVTGGFAEVSASATSVLAEQAIPASDLTQDAFAALIAEAKEDRDQASDTGRDVADKRLNDLTAMGAELGLSA
ncbi:F0F1 ATP synthase subunit epsilon [Halocynthiibacter styelae]|uniref:ATP synthase epsilon chain n=1 Tax=Halocynthiibacter styelae TaxID=2761955 RepID=A0A8J7LQE3_9RHOB|nr:F0F1 ATP synthase subunit epsilon [Paenihalocynthiibacter styelae]MBI1494237.1 F0F1 ATP synthase subunit epsilon [Paenihalocynthiibacter styelae]